MEIRQRVSCVESILPILWFLFGVSHFDTTPLMCQRIRRLTERTSVKSMVTPVCPPVITQGVDRVSTHYLTLSILQRVQSRSAIYEKLPEITSVCLAPALNHERFLPFYFEGLWLQ